MIVSGGIIDPEKVLRERCRRSVQKYELYYNRCERINEYPTKLCSGKSGNKNKYIYRYTCSVTRQWQCGKPLSAKVVGHEKVTSFIDGEVFMRK
jgi:hypothetical protein